MISSDDFPCYVSVDTHEKIDNPHLEHYHVDELRYFTSISSYMDWLIDLDADVEPWGTQ